jgi:hypothetical protein
MALSVSRDTLAPRGVRQLYITETSDVAIGASETTVVASTRCGMMERFGIQLFNSDASVAATAKVYGSLLEAPGTEGGSDWTQIGDDITVAVSSSAIKAIATTPLKHICVRATGNGADLTAYILGQER